MSMPRPIGARELYKAAALTGMLAKADPVPWSLIMPNHGYSGGGGAAGPPVVTDGHGGYRAMTPEERTQAEAQGLAERAAIYADAMVEEDDAHVE